MFQVDNVVAVDHAFDGDVLLEPLFKVVGLAVSRILAAAVRCRLALFLGGDERQQAKTAVRTVGKAMLALMLMGCVDMGLGLRPRERSSRSGRRGVRVVAAFVVMIVGAVKVLAKVGLDVRFEVVGVAFTLERRRGQSGKGVPVVVFLLGRGHRHTLAAVWQRL